MIPCHFQHNTVDGCTDVHFNIELDLETSQTFVSNLKFHSNYKSGLPEDAGIGYNIEETKYCLYGYKDALGKDFTVKVRYWLTSDLANDILEEIFKINVEQSAKFI